MILRPLLSGILLVERSTTLNHLLRRTLDAAGLVRPLDGDADGTELCDFGAVEAPFIPRLRVVRWKPVSPDE